MLQKTAKITKISGINNIHNLFTKNFGILEKNTCVFRKNDLIYSCWHSKALSANL